MGALRDEVINEAGAKALALGLLSKDGSRLDWIAASGFPPEMVEEDRTEIDLDTPRLPMTYSGPARRSECRTPRSTPPGTRNRAHWMSFTGTESIAAWPLAAGGDPSVSCSSPGRSPSPSTRLSWPYASAVATMVSQALVRAQIYADEHARAALLHSLAQPVAQVDTVGMEYRALYDSADSDRGLGGDWYSVMALPDRRTYLAIGDVIGHGLLSVEDMAQMRSTGNAYAHLGLSTAQILTELNHYAAHQIQGEFATNLVVIFDPEARTLSYSSAGHPPAMLCRAATGRRARLSDASGQMLGRSTTPSTMQATVTVEPGDVPIMYTDGLVEHYDADLNVGLGHLEEVVAAYRRPHCWIARPWPATSRPTPMMTTCACSLPGSTRTPPTELPPVPDVAEPTCRWRSQRGQRPGRQGGRPCGLLPVVILRTYAGAPGLSYTASAAAHPGSGRCRSV